MHVLDTFSSNSSSEFSEFSALYSLVRFNEELFESCYWWPSTLGGTQEDSKLMQSLAFSANEYDWRPSGS